MLPPKPGGHKPPVYRYAGEKFQTDELGKKTEELVAKGQ